MAYKDDSYYIDRVLNHADAGAFAGLVNKHKTMAFNIALRITRNREDAEEVAQDAFVKVYHSLSQFKGDSKFTTWLYKVVYNLGLSKIRKKSLISGSVNEDNFIEIADESGFEAMNNITQKEHKRHIEHAMNFLDENDQLLITLYYMDDQPIEEIAAITGLSVSNVKVRLFRSRKKMNDALKHNLKDELHSIL